MIFVENLKKNLVVATLVLIYFTQNTFYLYQGVSQYADILLSFFFLTALICANHLSDKKYITLAAFFIGCCMWTKNEGIMLAFLYMLFYLPLLFNKAHIKYTIAGIALPLLAVSIFKIGYAGANDIVSKQGHDTLKLLTSADRYQLIYQYFCKNVQEKFRVAAYAFYLYILVSIIKRQMPHKQMWLILLCLLGYMMVYVITPQGLDWHLNTSQDRVMNQLLPALIYVISLRLSDIHLPLFKKKIF